MTIACISMLCLLDISINLFNYSGIFSQRPTYMYSVNITSIFIFYPYVHLTNLLCHVHRVRLICMHKFTIIICNTFFNTRTYVGISLTVHSNYCLFFVLFYLLTLIASLRLGFFTSIFFLLSQWFRPFQNFSFFLYFKLPFALKLFIYGLF